MNVFAATITTSGASRNTVINGITAQYVSHQMQDTTGWYLPPTQGILLKGADDVLENSTVAYSTGDAVEVSGGGTIVTNNVIHDADTVGADIGAVRLLAGGVTVSHNTIYNSGRDGIQAEVAHATITYNTIHDIGLQTTEAGGIYTANTNGAGSVMAYNQIYNIHEAGYGGTALFADSSTSGWSIHNNITWNVDYGLKMNFTSHNNNIYNNTLGATKLSINSNQIGNWAGVNIYNNAFAKGIVVAPGAKIYNNVYSASSSGGMGAGDFSSGASGVVAVTPPSSTGGTTPPVTTPPVTTPPVTTPPVVTPPATTPSAKTKLMAVNYISTVNTKGDNFGGVGYAYNNSNVAFKLDFGTGVTKLTAGLAAIHPRGVLEIHLGSATGQLLGSINVAETGAWNKYTSQSSGRDETDRRYKPSSSSSRARLPYAGVAIWIGFSSA